MIECRAFTDLGGADHGWLSEGETSSSNSDAPPIRGIFEQRL